jgi:exodeoxyribonuclease V gamma subunit
MVPDMAPVAALIHAVWGRFAPEDPLRIPYSLTDQNAKDHPMASIVEAMLEGPNARVTLDDWLSWLEVPAFARAFDFPMDELFQVRSALKEAGIRWGLDAAHRLQSGMALSPQDAAPTTWMFGLQRLLLAQAQGPLHESEWQGIVPASGRSTLSPAALGALCSSLQTVREVLQKVQAPRPVASWVQDLQHMLNRLLRPNSESEEKALMALVDPLTRWLHACQIAGLTTDVSLSVVRSHWLSELAEAAAGNRFLSGGVQFATLLPMRSIPFKRVCLLGMNDGAYPRRQPLTDFDLMRLPDLRRPGDRSRREDDRYLFLEALLCAREKIYISWQGWQTHDPSQLYPSVLVGQLIEHLNATHTDPVVVRDAPMQAFSRRYFERPDAPWKTYATDWAVARGWQDPSDTSARVPYSPQEATEVALPDILKLTELIGMLRQPLDVFYRHRLGLKWQEPEEVLPDAEPFKLETLDTYRLVAAALQEPEQFSVQARASGRLPLGPMADPPLRQLNSQIKALTDRMAGVLQGGDWQALPEQNLLWPLPPTSTHLGMRQLQATTGDNHWYTNSRGEWIQAMLRPGVMTKKKVLQIHGLLSAWVHHLMANACGRSCTTHLLCLDQAKVLSPLAADQASEQLMALLEAYRQAWQSPMPVPGRTACEWLAQKHKPSKSDADKLTQQAHRQAKAIFMGSRFSTREPERLSAPMIRRHANDYNQVMGPIETWAPQLYLGLIQALQGSSEADAEADDE